MKLNHVASNHCNQCGAIIRMLRCRLDLSQEELAAQLQLAGLNLNQKAISRIETGKRVVPDYELLFFSKFFSVPVIFLLESHHLLEDPNFPDSLDQIENKDK